MKKILVVVLCLFLLGCSASDQVTESIPENLRSQIDVSGADRVVKMYFDEDLFDGINDGESLDSVLADAKEETCYYFVTKGRKLLRAYDPQGNSVSKHLYDEFVWNRLVEEYLSNRYIRMIAPGITVNDACILGYGDIPRAMLCAIYYETNQGPYIYIAWSGDEPTEYLFPLEEYPKVIRYYNKIGDFSTFRLSETMAPYNVQSKTFLMNVWYRPWVIGGASLLLVAAVAVIIWKKCRTQKAS